MPEATFRFRFESGKGDEIREMDVDYVTHCFNHVEPIKIPGVKGQWQIMSISEAPDIGPSAHNVGVMQVPDGEGHVMVDLETMGVGRSPAILTIGAVTFDPNAEMFEPFDPRANRLRLKKGLRTFYRKVSLADCLKLGLDVSPATILWWITGASDAARKELIGLDDKSRPTGLPLAAALQEFSEWLPQDPRIWANGAAEDLVWLTSAYEACDLIVPWTWRQQRCYRTMRALVDAPRPGVAQTMGYPPHHALGDAIDQAAHLVNICKRIERR